MPRVIFIEAMCGLLVVNLGDRSPVDRDLEFAIRESNDRMDRHFKVPVLAFLSDQEVVGMDFVDLTEQGSIVGHYWSPDRDAFRSMWIVCHRLPSINRPELS
jgi:hypothetical protein